MLTQEEQEQFAELWTEAQPNVSHYIHSVIRDVTAARDVLQSTALVLLRKFEQYDSNQPFLPWAIGIAKFQILSHRRDSARELVTFDSNLLDRFTETWSEVAPNVSDESSALQECLKRIQGRAKEVVQLRYFEDLNSTEIAERLQLKSGNIRVMLQRARETLRKCVATQMEREGRMS